MKLTGFFMGCIIILTAAMPGCSKSSDPPGTGPHIIDLNDNTTPVVDIYSPANNQVFSSGDTIKISGRITDNGLYQGYIRIINDANQAILKEQLYEIHGFQLYNYYLEYKTSVTVASDYTITVQFEDHGLNMGSRSVKVKVNP
jgi:hypothetical protein